MGHADNASAWRHCGFNKLTALEYAMRSLRQLDHYVELESHADVADRWALARPQVRAQASAAGCVRDRRETNANVAYEQCATAF